MHACSRWAEGATPLGLPAAAAHPSIAGLHSPLHSHPPPPTLTPCLCCSPGVLDTAAAAAAAAADVLLASSTVRESIMIAALLKLPRGMAYAEKVERVEAILKELVSTRTHTFSNTLALCALCVCLCTNPCRPLQRCPLLRLCKVALTAIGCVCWPRLLVQDLEGCQHTLIGDELLQMKGISGGQRRRVSGACHGGGHCPAGCMWLHVCVCLDTRLPCLTSPAPTLPCPRPSGHRAGQVSTGAFFG